MTNRLPWPRLFLPALLLALVPVWLPATEKAAADHTAIIDAFVTGQHTDDLDGMIKQRQIRAVVAWNRTDYFIEKGQQYGMAYEAIREFEAWLNRRYQRTLRRIHVVIVPVSRSELLGMLVAGKADIAVAGLTITPERAQQIDFSLPIHAGVSEIVVSRRNSPLLQNRDNLAGQVFFVRESSSYRASLNALTSSFVLAGHAPITVRHADEHLEDEDILELVNAGIIEHTVVDDYKARLWASLLPDIRIEPVTVRDGASLAWGLRKGTPKLQTVVNDFIRGHRIGTEFGNVLVKRYYGNNRWLRAPLSQQEVARFDAVVDIFNKYAAQYRFDPLLVTAQGFQESGLDQRARSAEGAVGIMQLLPRTGKAMQVGDIRQTDANIHAGIKYLRALADDYFSAPNIDAYNRTLLAFAAYNAGPGNIRKMQRLAAARGLNSGKWFDNVERVTGERIGREPVRYVANITRYYIAYKLLEEQRQAREKAMDTAGQRPM